MRPSEVCCQPKHWEGGATTGTQAGGLQAHAMGAQLVSGQDSNLSSLTVRTAVGRALS